MEGSLHVGAVLGRICYARRGASVPERQDGDCRVLPQAQAFLSAAHEASPGPERAERKQNQKPLQWTAVSRGLQEGAEGLREGAEPSGHLAQGLCCTFVDSQQEFQEKPLGSHHLTVMPRGRYHSCNRRSWQIVCTDVSLSTLLLTIL